MDFSLFYFAADSATPDAAGRYDLLLRGARFADTHGFTAVWTPERHFDRFGGLYPNPSVVSAAVAAVTERVAIRAGSVVAPLHHPVRIAEEWSVVDNLSGGRVGISFASGWHAVDFALRPETYADRKAATVEAVEQVRRLWRGEALPLVDAQGRAAEIRIYPPPVQPELPVWITAAGDPETFRTAGTLGAGVLTHLWLHDLDELAVKLEIYRKALAERPEHDGWPGRAALMVHTYLDTDDERARDLVRAPLCDFLKTSFHLVAQMAQTNIPGFDISKLRESHVDALVRRSFDRYVDGRGLIGGAATAADFVARARAIGVDELACLIDFGLPTPTVLSGLERLDQLRGAEA
jgi:natural product biosynthesis luciferase-like monooxygenase protein